MLVTPPSEQLFKVKVNRRLNAIVFGESVLNDAMSIVLFVIFTSLLSEVP